MRTRPARRAAASASMRNATTFGTCYSPYPYSETCSMMDWLRLNIELLPVTGEAKYAEQIEKIAYNAMLGAHSPTASAGSTTAS